MCKNCNASQVSCEECEHNIGIENSASHIAGPCGQQNCWYSCTVCEHNNGCYKGDDFKDGIAMKNDLISKYCEE